MSNSNFEFEHDAAQGMDCSTLAALQQCLFDIVQHSNSRFLNDNDL